MESESIDYCTSTRDKVERVSSRGTKREKGMFSSFAECLSSFCGEGESERGIEEGERERGEGRERRERGTARLSREEGDGENIDREARETPADVEN